MLSDLALHGEPSISQDDPDGSLRIAQERENGRRPEGQRDDGRIDFIEAKVVPRLAVGSKSTNSHTDETDAQVTIWGKRSWIASQEHPDAALLGVVEGRYVPVRKVLQLQAVLRVAVY